MHEIEWIFFDIGSTLVDESKAFYRRIDEAVKGTDITYQQFYDVMIKYYRENQKGDLKALEYFGLAKPRWHKEDEELYPDAAECLEKLSSEYHIGVIANQSAGTEERLRKYGVLKYIDLVIASAEEGMAKPDVKIFETALERAGCKPQNAVMVGDRIDNDIAPAKSVGMKTVWIKQGYNKYYNPRKESEAPDYIANDLNEVCRIFLM